MGELLNTASGLEMTGGDDELYRELLGFYLTENKFDVKELLDLSIKSSEESASYIHRIKGASRQIGAELASEKGQEIEDIFRKKAEGNLAKLINDFCKIYEDTLKAVNRYLAS